MAVWTTEEDVMLERWALRVMTLTPMVYGNAFLLVERFRLAGGDEALFTNIERIALNSGHDFAFLIRVILDTGLIHRPSHK